MLQPANGGHQARRTGDGPLIDAERAALCYPLRATSTTGLGAERGHILLAAPPRRCPWKTIEVVVRDPDGFVVVFIAPDTPAEFQAVQARTTADLDRMTKLRRCVVARP